MSQKPPSARALRAAEALERERDAIAHNMKLTVTRLADELAAARQEQERLQGELKRWNSLFQGDIADAFPPTPEQAWKFYKTIYDTLAKDYDERSAEYERLIAALRELTDSWRKQAGLLRTQDSGRTSYGRAAGLTQAADELDGRLPTAGSESE